MEPTGRVAPSIARLLSAVAGFLCVLCALISPAVVRAADPARLSIAPVGVSGSFFALTASPGERVQLTVRLGNAGAATVSARTFAADAYTIVDGGFGARLDGEPTSGATNWLDYPPQTLSLAPGAGVQRTFSVSVPPDTQPGEFLTSLVIQNAEPVPGAGSQGAVGIAFLQVNRQVIAVSITVPGPLVPRLEIGGATHSTVAGKSSIAVGVLNPGNVRLNPTGEFALHDAAGAEVSRYAVVMDSFYAGTETSIEVPFARRLNAGRYVATLTLNATAAGLGVTAVSEPLPIIILSNDEENGVLQPPAGALGTPAPPRTAAVNQAPDTMRAAPSAATIAPTDWVTLALAMLLGAAGAIVVLMLIFRRRPVPRGAALLVLALASGGALLGGAAALPSVAEAAPCTPIAPNQPSQFQGCAYNGQTLAGVDGSGSSFNGATFNGAILTGSNFAGASFVNATLDGANLTNVNLSGANLTGATLNGVNFTGANLLGATLTGATFDVAVVWSNTTCPDGSLSTNNGSTCTGHLGPPPASTIAPTATTTSTATPTPASSATVVATQTSSATATATATTATNIPTAAPTSIATAAPSSTPGSRSATTADLTLGAVAYSHSGGTGSGVMIVTATDPTGSGAGWHVTIRSSDFAYSGPNSGATIPAASFSIASAGAPTLTAGQPVDPTGGPRVPAGGGFNVTLDQPRTVLQANGGFGAGTYTQTLGVLLAIPPQARAGTYAATLVVDMIAAP